MRTCCCSSINLKRSSDSVSGGRLATQQTAPARLDHIARVAGVKWENVVPVAEVFRTAGRYFLTPQTGKLNPDTVLDISHESLIRNWKRLQAWVEDEALAAGIYQRLERDAQEWKQGGDVLSPVRLAAVNAWEKRFQPTEAWAQRYGGSFGLAMEFLKASRAQREEEARQAEIATRQKKLNKGLAIALVVALGLIGWAVYQTFEANHSLGQALMYRALSEWNSDKPLSALPPAVAASTYDNKIDPSAAINDPFLPHVHYYRQIRHSAEVSALAVHPAGELLAAALRDGSVDLVNPQTGRIDRSLPPSKSLMTDDKSANVHRPREPLPKAGRETHPDPASIELAFSPQGDRLFCADGSELRIWSVPSGKLLSPLTGNTTTSIAVARSGMLALGFADGTLQIFRDGNVAKDQPSKKDGPLKSLTISPDERLVAGIIQGTLRVWQWIEDSKLERLQTRYEYDEPTARAVSFSPDGTKLIVGTDNGDLLLHTVSLKERPLRAESARQSGSDSQGRKLKGLQARSLSDGKPETKILPPLDTISIKFQGANHSNWNRRIRRTRLAR